MDPLKEVDFAFGLEQGVTIKPSDRGGKVIGMMIDRDKVQWFLVQYIDNVGVVRQEYFRSTDLA